MVTVICKQVAIILCTLSYCCEATLKAHVYAPAHKLKGPIVTCPAISGYANISHVALSSDFVITGRLAALQKTGVKVAVHAQHVMSLWVPHVFTLQNHAENIVFL